MAVKKSRSMLEKATDQVRVLRLRKDDTVIVRKWPGMTYDDRKKITSELRKKSGYLSGITLIFVDKFSDVRTLNEGQMRANGWVRASG